jgi:hypothetical protein
MAAKQVRWRERPQAKDLRAAAAYLTLILPDRKVTDLVAKLNRATTIRALPKDIERASGLGLLPRTDPEVADKLRKMKNGEALSPILLVRGRMSKGVALIIADGYHRVCAAYLVDQDADIPCLLVDLN